MPFYCIIMQHGAVHAFLLKAVMLVAFFSIILVNMVVSEFKSLFLVAKPISLLIHVVH